MLARGEMPQEDTMADVQQQGNAQGTAEGNEATQQAASTNDAQTAVNDTETTADAAPLTWDGWLGEQPDEVKTLIDTHTSGLKNALDSERTQRKTIEKQLKELGKQAEDGSELRASLDKLSEQISAANARADFFEAASDPALGLRDAGLAWTILSSNPDEFTRRGKPDFDALKDAHPILFEQPRPASVKTNAGSGTGHVAPVKNAGELMNDFIRGSVNK